MRAAGSVKAASGLQAGRNGAQEVRPAAHGKAGARAIPCLLLCIFLVGCKGAPVKPDEPLPPRVDCRQHDTSHLKPPPYFVWEFPSYLAEVIGLLIEERRLRGLEQDCIEEHKAKGVIR